jgi:hypothetical protein
MAQEPTSAPRKAGFRRFCDIDWHLSYISDLESGRRKGESHQSRKFRRVPAIEPHRQQAAYDALFFVAGPAEPDARAAAVLVDELDPGQLQGTPNGQVC